MRERTRRRVAHARASHAQKRQPGARELLLRAPANRDTHTHTHKHTHTHTARQLGGAADEFACGCMGAGPGAVLRTDWSEAKAGAGRTGTGARLGGS